MKKKTTVNIGVLIFWVGVLWLLVVLPGWQLIPVFLVLLGWWIVYMETKD